MEILGMRGMIALVLLAPFGVIVSSFLLSHVRLNLSILMVAFVVLGLCLVYFSPQLFEKMGRIHRLEDSKAIQIQEHFVLQGVYLNTMDVHNAAALGFGKNKSVVFTQKTWNESSHEVLYGVTAHEVGHQLYYHSIFQILIIAIVVFLLLLVDRSLISWGFTKRYALLIIACFVCILCYLALSRQKEQQADRYAKEQGYGVGLASYFQLFSDSYSGSYIRYYNMWYLHDSLKKRTDYLQQK